MASTARALLLLLQAAAAAGGSVHAAVLEWGSSLQSPEAAGGAAAEAGTFLAQGCDLLLGSDLVYSSQQVPSLVAVLQHVLPRVMPVPGACDR